MRGGDQNFPAIPEQRPMTGDVHAAISATVDAIYRNESRRVLATLIRLLGSFDLAEEALHDAFTAAVEQWPQEGVPSNPRAWLVSAGRFKAIDKIRRRAKFDQTIAELVNELDADAEIAPEREDESVEDD